MMSIKSLFAGLARTRTRQPEAVAVTAREIHEYVYAMNGDFIIEEVPQASPLLERDAKALIGQGFSSNPIVTSYHEHVRASKEKEVEIDSKRRQNAVRAHFAMRYPYKYLTLEQVMDVCEKYGLCCGHVSLFTSPVPSKNLGDLSRCSIRTEDKAIQTLNENEILNRTAFQFDDCVRLVEPGEYATDECESWVVPKFDRAQSASGLFIVARREDFVNDRNVILVKNSLVMIVDKDPIVLQPVAVFEEGDAWDADPNVRQTRQTVGFLVITAWGAEAEHSEVVNERMN